MTGQICNLSLGFLPVKGVWLWGEHGFQGAEKGEHNSLKTSLFPASETRAEGLEGCCCAVWPVDVGSGRGERAVGKMEQDSRARAADRDGIEANSAVFDYPEASTPLPRWLVDLSPYLARLPILDGVVPLPSRRPQSERAFNLMR